MIETVWNIPGGAVTATAIEATQDDRGTFHKLVVWGHGKRYDVAKATEICHIAAEIRHVHGGRRRGPSVRSSAAHSSVSGIS